MDPFFHKARKRFGQNFLTDSGIINRIVSSIRPKADDNLLEIGPGKGAITALLLEANPTLNIVEIDRDLVPILLAQFDSRYPELKVHQADALKFDFSELAQNQPLRIVGNLPYNISTPLIFHLLSFHGKVKDMHFMLQKEVVDRMAAAAGEKSYGRLSIMVQYYCKVDNLFPVPPECFQPQPKVDSAIVRLTPFTTQPKQAVDVKLFERIVNVAFQQRRKTLRNGLKQLLNTEQLDSISTTNLSLRAETLGVADFVELSNELSEMGVSV